MTLPTEYELTAVGAEVIPVQVVIVGTHPAVLEATWAGETHRIEGRDFQVCLFDLRRRLEAEGRLLCCQGARRDVGPSGQLRQFSDGREMYLHPVGRRQVTHDDIVDVFSPADCGLVTTVEEQEGLHREWMLGGR
jgi:hypothetical protein